MRSTTLSSSSWQKCLLLLILFGAAALWIPAVSASDATDWNAKGITFFNKGQYNDALTAYNKALELDPNYAIAWNNKGNALYRLGRYDEALAAYNKTLELDPNYIAAWTNKGNALYRLGRYDEALAAYNKTLELDPNNADAKENKNIVVSKLSQGTTTFVTTSTTQAPTPIITTSGPTQIPTSQAPASFNPMIIVGIILLLCIGGGGYYVLHLRKLRSPDAEIHLPTPKRVITALKPEKRGIPRDDLTPRVNALAARAAKLYYFKEQALPLITKLLEQLSNDNVPLTKNAVQETESVLTCLESCERKISEWKQEGFNTSPLEKLQDSPVHAILEIFGRYEQNISRLQTVKNRIQTIESSYPEFGKDLNANARITAVKLGLSTIDSPEAVESELYAIETELEKIRKSQKQKEDEVRCSEQVTALQKKAKERLAEAQKTGTIPESIVQQATAQDILILETAIHNIDDFINSATPQLSLTPEKTQFVVGKWHRLPIHIINTGTAHAVDVSFTFSDEFETKWIEPATIPGVSSTDVIIGLRPKQDGNIPLEVQVQYHDSQNRTYNQTFKYWIEVLDSHSAAGAQPPSTFTPKPVTPRQPPAELADRYTDWEFIGKGGFGRVFKAKRKDGQFVAVKIPISIDESTGKSFIAELQNWTRLNHTNIVKVYNFNIMPCPYFEMELCDNSLAKRNKPIEGEEAAWILFNVCEGLKFTHSNKIIHRDLKPQNILLKKGVPKISDWGLSRVITESTSTTATSFTPYYAAPEQISSEHKDERTDIWQLGVIFYELVTGQLPFTGDSIVAVMAAITTKNPQPPSGIVPTSLDVEAMIMKCLEKSPGERYQSVLELQKDLALYLRITYAESLKMSVTANNPRRSAFYCGDLVMVNLLTGDIKSAYKYLTDLENYAEGDVKIAARELSEQILVRMESGITEIPEELIAKANLIAHKVSLGFGKM